MSHSHISEINVGGCQSKSICLSKTSTNACRDSWWHAIFFCCSVCLFFNLMPLLIAELQYVHLENCFSRRSPMKPFWKISISKWRFPYFWMMCTYADYTRNIRWTYKRGHRFRDRDTIIETKIDFDTVSAVCHRLNGCVCVCALRVGKAALKHKLPIDGNWLRVQIHSVSYFFVSVLVFISSRLSGPEMELSIVLNFRLYFLHHLFSFFTCEMEWPNRTWYRRYYHCFIRQ